ncbi:MAG: hypothetical protein RIS26_369 [Actinomycetota bacterium]|jgi:putative thioredoxin
MSMTGGMDLSKLKAPADVASEALAVPELVTTATEGTLPSLVKISQVAPVVLEFHSGETDELLKQAVLARKGQLLLARADITAEPRIAQAFGAKGVPSVFAIVKGQPVPMFEGRLTEEQYSAVLEQLLAAAKAQGVGGKLLEGGVEAAIPELPKPLQEALALVDAGEVDQALELLTKLKSEKPGDAATSALLAQVMLMKRTMELDHEAILASQPANFDEAMVLADVLAAIGDFQSSFDLLLAIYVQVTKDEQALIKPRMLEYFEIAGPTNESVKSARARLATLLY